MTRSFLLERIIKFAKCAITWGPQNTQKTKVENAFRTEKDVISGEARSSTSCRSLNLHESLPIGNVDEFSELVQDQPALSFKIGEKSQVSSEITDDSSQLFRTVRSMGEVDFSYVPEIRLSRQPCPSMLAENELLRQHTSSVRDLCDSERARTEILRQDLEHWRAQSSRWKSTYSVLMRKLEKLRGAIASERADRVVQIARQAEKFHIMEKKN